MKSYAEAAPDPRRRWTRTITLFCLSPSHLQDVSQHPGSRPFTTQRPEEPEPAGKVHRSSRVDKERIFSCIFSICKSRSVTRGCMMKFTYKIQRINCFTDSLSNNYHSQHKEQQKSDQSTILRYT